MVYTMVRLWPIIGEIVNPKEEMLFFRASTQMKDLIRLRAARQRKNMSELVRDLVEHALGEPTEEERVFLPQSGPQTARNEQCQ